MKASLTIRRETRVSVFHPVFFRRIVSAFKHKLPGSTPALTGKSATFLRAEFSLCRHSGIPKLRWGSALFACRGVPKMQLEFSLLGPEGALSGA